MNDFTLTKKERRCLYRMRFCTHTPKSKIYNFHELYEHGFIKPNYTGERDPLNAPIPNGTYRLSDKYWRYIEEHRWFTWEYVLSHLAVPIVVAVLAAIITAKVLGK